MTNRVRRTAFSAAATSVLMLVAAACSSGGGDDPAARAPADTGTAEASPPAGEAREPGLYVLELGTGEIKPLAGVDPDALALAPAVSPDGSRIAFDAGTDGSRQVWVMNADGSELEQVTDDDVEAVDPEWSPDGRSLAYVGYGRETTRGVMILDLGSGKAERVSSEPGDVFGPDWSPDGSSIVYQTPAGDGWQLHTVDLESGTTTTVCCRGGDSIASDADWSSDGELLLFGYATPQDNFALHTITPSGDDDTPVPPLDPTRYHGHPVWSPDGSKIAYQGAPGIWVLDLETGEETMLDPDLWGPVWLDDDTLIVAMPPNE